MASERLMSISQDERERAIFRSRRMYQPDLEFNLATAEDNGINKGIAIGTEKAMISSIQSLMNHMHWTAEQAMSALAIPQEKRTVYQNYFTKK